MVNSSREGSRRCAVHNPPRAACHGIEKRRLPSKPKRSRVPPPREITLRPVSAPTGLAGNTQKLHAEATRLKKLPVGSRYRKQRLQVVEHALKLATASKSISSQDEVELDRLLSSLSL